MSNTIASMTVDDLKTTLRDVIREELSAVGTQSDFDFLRRVHSMWESSVNKVGTAVVLAVMGLAATLVGLGSIKFGK
jgi:hypothetical protein